MKKNKCKAKYGVIKAMSEVIWLIIFSSTKCFSPRSIRELCKYPSKKTLIGIRMKAWKAVKKDVCLVISLPSALKTLFFMLYGSLSKKIANWKIKYVNIINSQPGTYKNPDSLLAKISPMVKSIVPSKADITIRLRSFEKNLSIYITRLLANRFIKNIIPQKSPQFLVFLLCLHLILIFNVDFALAIEEENKCLSAISKYEAKYNIPKGLLKAIGSAESNFRPYALNNGIKSYNFYTKEEAQAEINNLIKQEKYNFDVGCMQINYLWHNKYFSSISEMLEVNANVRYAAAYLYSLYKIHNSWHKAVRFYHSNNPEHYRKYSSKIALIWAKG